MSTCLTSVLSWMFGGRTHEVGTMTRSSNLESWTTLWLLAFYLCVYQTFLLPASEKKTFIFQLGWWFRLISKGGGDLFDKSRAVIFPTAVGYFLLQLQHRQLSVGSDGNEDGTRSYQERSKLESGRIEETSPGNTRRAHSWDRVQCIMGEDRLQQRTDEPENK